MRGALALALAAVVLVSCAKDRRGPHGAPATLRVGTTGSIQEVYGSAPSGTIIELTPGQHPAEVLRREPGAPPLEAPVVIQGPDGGTAVLEGLDVFGPAVTVRNVTLRGGLQFRPGADGSRAESIDATGGWVVLSASNSALVSSRVTPMNDHDAVYVGAYQATPPDGVLVQGNVLGPSELSSPSSAAHLDCLQVATATNLVVRDNLLAGCAAQTVLVKADQGPIEHVRITRNAIQSCHPQTSTCGAFNALHVSGQAGALVDVVIDHNSIDGGLHLGTPSTGIQVRGNAITDSDSCGPELDGNVVGSTFCVDRLSPSNVVGEVLFAARDAWPPDLRPAPRSAAIDFGVAPIYTDDDIRACGPWDAGAYELCPPAEVDTVATVTADSRTQLPTGTETLLPAPGDLAATASDQATTSMPATDAATPMVVGARDQSSDRLRLGALIAAGFIMVNVVLIARHRRFT
jgi:hypothetical protein